MYSMSQQILAEFYPDRSTFGKMAADTVKVVDSCSTSTRSVTKALRYGTHYQGISVFPTPEGWKAE